MRKFLGFMLAILLIGGSVDAFAFVLKGESAAKNSAARRSDSGFTLKDQNDASYAVGFPNEKVTVLIFGDREGAEQIEGWVRPIYDKYGNNVNIYGIAELSAVPRLARPVVRRIIKSKTDYSVLLDWSGAVSKSYDYQKGKANVVIVAKDGSVLGKYTGAASQSGLRGVYNQINGGL